MRRLTISLLSLGFAAVGVLSLANLTHAKHTHIIEAIRGKQYVPTKQHGPWMILVATFREPPPEVRTQGLTPQQAANELVYELRAKGIPAYTFSQEGLLGDDEANTGQGGMRKKHYRDAPPSISVLAGNFKEVDPETKEGRRAQDTLDVIKRFHPKFLQSVDKSNGILTRLTNGGIYRITPGRPGPLSGAFLTINPLLSPEEARQKKSSALLLKLNAGNEYSLLENAGKYTLIVASFHGKSMIQAVGSRSSKSESNFDVSTDLYECAQAAWELAKTLRNHEKQFEAYVWHDKYSSIVTVGSFNSPNDPRLAKLADIFRAKIKPHPNTGQDILLAEFITIPANPAPGTLPEKKWMFDPIPKLMEVPRL